MIFSPFVYVPSRRLRGVYLALPACWSPLRAGSGLGLKSRSQALDDLVGVLVVDRNLAPLLNEPGSGRPGIPHAGNAQGSPAAVYDEAESDILRFLGPFPGGFPG